jgi:hypothetical protein
MEGVMFTEGEWVKATGIGYCCIRTGSMGDKTGKVIADMRMVDGYYNTFDASVMCAAKDMYEFLEAKLHHLPLEDQHAASEILKKARGEQ